MLLVGYTGLMSLGHAAFLGIGAYVNSVFLAQGALPRDPAARGPVHRALRRAIGRPTLRMSGLYLAIATLAFGSIVGTVFQKWGRSPVASTALPCRRLIFSVSRSRVRPVSTTSLGRASFRPVDLSQFVAISVGRAMVAIRDSEVSAQSMGIDLARYRP